MNDCDAVRTELPAYLAGELSDEQEETFRAHLERCRACAGELREMEGVVDLLGTAPLDRLPRATLESEVFALTELDDIRKLAEAAPLEYEPPADLEDRAFARAGIGDEHAGARRSRVAAFAAPGLAVIAVVLAGLGIGWRAEVSDLRDQVDRASNIFGPSGRTMGTVKLTGLATQANAEIVEAQDNFRFQLHASGMPVTPANTHYEVWLGGAEGWVSCGGFKVTTPLREIDLPFQAPVSPEDFPMLDITLEPDDGNPAKSGPSIMDARLDVSETDL